MRHPLSGAHYSAADIRARTELVLAERFAQVCSVEQALAGWMQIERRRTLPAR